MATVWALLSTGAAVLLLVLYLRRRATLARYRATVSQANQVLAAYAKRESQLRNLLGEARGRLDFEADLYDEVWHTRDFDREPPGGYPNLVDDLVRVAGVSYRAEFVSRFAIGENLSVEPVLEPDNPENPNAIAVYGRWYDYEHHGYYREQLGYLESGFADRLAGVDIALTLAAVYPSIEPGKYAGVRVRIWRA